jgi:catalase
MGTGVLVDGLDFSDDKMLVGRTFSYSDTQRYRVGPELPAAAGEPAEERARAHQPARRADVVRRGPGAGAEPARQLRAVDLHNGLHEAPRKPNNPPEIRGG